MNDLTEFLNEFGISRSDFDKTGIIWDELLEIRKDYEKYIPELTPPANYLIDTFHQVKIIHSVRFRIKSSSHLLEKIIRKRLEEPNRIIDIKNYKDEVTDLIGLRALHLFKEDWLLIHRFITNTWDLKEAPIAYYRNGDSLDYIDGFKSNGCIVKEHPFGYRSVHYLVKTSPNKTTYVTEVQVRTIFEEGWSEIDHIIRYPYDKNSKLLNQFLVIFNRLSGSADEMGSYVQYLKYELDKREKEFSEAVSKKVQIIEDLKSKIKDLELQPKIAREWVNELDNILNLPNLNPAEYQFKSPDFYKIVGPSDFPIYNSYKISDSGEIKIPDWNKMHFPDYSVVKPFGLNIIEHSEESELKSETIEEKPKLVKKKRKLVKKKPNLFKKTPPKINDSLS